MAEFFSSWGNTRVTSVTLKVTCFVAAFQFAFFRLLLWRVSHLHLNIFLSAWALNIGANGYSWKNNSLFDSLRLKLKCLSNNVDILMSSSEPTDQMPLSSLDFSVLRVFYSDCHILTFPFHHSYLDLKWAHIFYNMYVLPVKDLIV